jgi:cobalt-zinc-cadmium efflux system outer membrane protein
MATSKIDNRTEMEMCVHRWRRLAGLAICAAWLAAGLRAQPNPPAPPDAQGALTWSQVKEKFEAANPSLRAGQVGIQESKAQEITANLRPNPGVNLLLDQLDPFTPNPYRPLGNALPAVAFSYLHERERKRELRLESARQATGIAESQQTDLERNLLFSLRTAFVGTLQAKALLANARETLDTYDRELGIHRERFRAGDIAQVDLSRLLLQRVQFATDVENAQVGLRTAKISLLMLVNDRTPVDRFDIAGAFDFDNRVPPLEEIHSAALEARPDLRAVRQAIVKAQTDHKLAVANGSTDPTFGVDFGRNPPIPAYVGFSVNIPLRVFDRNQGEKERTQLDIQRAERQRDVVEAQVFSDVDSAYVTLLSALNLLRTYKETYLQIAMEVRDTMSFSYRHGQAALVDYLGAERDYRAIQVDYINLVGSYLTAAGQLNLAAGREVIP